MAPKVHILTDSTVQMYVMVIMLRKVETSRFNVNSYVII